MIREFGVAGAVFFAALAATFFVALIGRLRAKKGPDEDLAGRRLNRWLVGLSAGATGNSGFIVTGAVGLGYVGGAQWLMLPIAWLLGDLIYWSFVPARLNQTARRANATTLSEFLTFDLSGSWARAIGLVVALLLFVFLSAYTAAQWLAGRKFLSAVFDFSDFSALLFFSLTIVVYSAIGGFRGSVYADTFQAVVRIIGTLIAIVFIVFAAASDTPTFHANIAGAGVDFLNPFPNGLSISTFGFIGGYAFAAIGFGLGQPQIITRYFAGSSPEETMAARWIYIGFLQSTWIAMTVFGILLRGVMPGIEDPETGFSVFFQNNVPAIITGIIFADVYATIASTSNSLLVAIAQTFQRDVLHRLTKTKEQRTSFFTILLIGIGTIFLSMILPGNVFTIAIGAVSMIGAAVAGPVLVKIMGWSHTSISLFCSIVVGILAAFAWQQSGASAVFNEAGIGILASLLTNWLVAGIGPRSSAKASSN
jgi:Na+/proline symporter